MPLQIHPPAQETLDQLREALASAFEGDPIEVRGGGGHFEIKVVSKSFEGANRLARQRRVYKAIAHLMDGDAAPVHAVDRLVTEVPS
jgi:acid stress-induced BolA-like protein IbaG/YrbA